MKLRVTIGYQQDFPPFVHDDAGPVGLVVDALGPCLDQLGIEGRWVPLALAAQIPALQGGRVDMIAALGVTPERREEVVFGETIVHTGGALFFRRGAVADAARIVTPTSGPLAAPTRRTFPDCDVLEAADYPDALRQVVDGEADAAALNLHVGAAVANREHPGLFEIPTEPFVVIDLAPAFAPTGDPELREALDRMIRSMVS